MTALLGMTALILDDQAVLERYEALSKPKASVPGMMDSLQLGEGGAGSLEQQENEGESPFRGDGVPRRLMDRRVEGGARISFRDAVNHPNKGNPDGWGLHRELSGRAKVSTKEASRMSAGLLGDF